MGRHSSGAVTTGEVLRIELSYLLKKKLIKKGGINEGILSWNTGGWISFTSSFTDEERYLRLVYNNTDKSTGIKSEHDYKIYFDTIPSNLGKGEVIYFICPISGKRVRILYKCYGSHIWKGRKAYHNRIYYESQQCSKFYYHSVRYWSLDKKLEELYKIPIKKLYMGKETRSFKRINHLQEKKEYHDLKRWTILPKSLQKALSPYL